MGNPCLSAEAAKSELPVRWMWGKAVALSRYQPPTGQRAFPFAGLGRRLQPVPKAGLHCTGKVRLRRAILGTGRSALNANLCCNFNELMGKPMVPGWDRFRPYATVSICFFLDFSTDLYHNT